MLAKDTLLRLISIGHSESVGDLNAKLFQSELAVIDWQTGNVSSVKFCFCQILFLFQDKHIYDMVCIYNLSIVLLYA
jgi:hypothetical protein